MEVMATGTMIQVFLLARRLPTDADDRSRVSFP